MQLCGDISVQGRTFQEKNVYTRHKWFFIPSYAQSVIEIAPAGTVVLDDVPSQGPLDKQG